MTDYQTLLRQSSLDVSRETSDKLTAFEQVFHKWSTKINLVAPSTKDDFLQRHIVDSAQLYPILQGQGAVADLGSGGGFPGIITAILASESGRKCHLVESNNKKAAFLRTALYECDVEASVHPVRVEASYDAVGKVEWVTARALASLHQLLVWSESWTSSSTGQDTGSTNSNATPAKLLLPKGRNVSQEIEEARRGFSFDLIEHRSIVDRESCILEISHIKRVSE